LSECGEQNVEVPQLVPFGDDCSGDLFCFDLREKRSHGDPPIVLYAHSGDETEPVTDSFLEFLSKEYRNAKGELGRPIEPQTTTVRIPGIKKFKPGSWVGVPELARHGLDLQVIDPELTDDSYADDPSPFPRHGPEPEPKNMIAFSIYKPDDSEAWMGDRIQFGYTSIVLFDRSRKKLVPVNTGSAPRLKALGTKHPHTLFWFGIDGPLTGDETLEFTFEAESK
jgi:hypothetical protein